MKSHTDMLVNSNLTVTKTQWLHNCLLQHNFDLHSQGPKVLHPETSPQTYCIKFADYIKNLIQTVKRNHDLISEYSELINHLLPPDIEPHLTSKRRGILDFGGSLLSGLFGVATKADLEKLAGQLQAIGVALRKGGDTHKQSMDSMASFSKIINTRMATLVDTVKQTALNTAETFNSFAEDMFSELGFMVQMQKKLVAHETSVKAVLTHLQLFYNAMTQLTTGTLPNFLVTPQMLQASINDITSLANSYDPPLRLINKKPLQYYRRCVYTYAVINQHLVISLAFQMTHFDPSFDVYKIFYYPLVVPGQPNSTMQLKFQESGVAFQRNFEHFFFLTSDELLELKVTNTLDRLFRTVKLMTNNTCIVSLFHNNKMAIKEHCQYTITVNTVQPSFLWLNLNHFLLTGAYEYQLRCATGMKQTHPGCKTQCILTPASECQILTATAISVPLISNASALPVMHQYVVNYPYLLHFFQQEEIQALEGGDFLEAPPTFHLPPLKLFVNPIQSLVAEEIKSQLEMTNVVESIKSESLLINSLEDGILFTTQASSKIFGDSLEYITLFMLILLCLITLQLTYCTIKLRTFSLLLAVLQQNITPKANAQGNDHPLLLAFTVKSEQSAPQENFHIVFTAGINMYWSYIAIGIFLTLGFVLLTRYLRKRFCTAHDPMTSDLVFQFSTLDHTVIVHIKTFARLPTDLKIMYSTQLTNFRIVSFLPPVLTFVWDAMVYDRTTRMSTLIPTRIPISPITVWQLRRILSDKFELQLLLKANRDFTKILMESNQISGRVNSSSGGPSAPDPV